MGGRRLMTERRERSPETWGPCRGQSGGPEGGEGFSFSGRDGSLPPL